MPKLSEVFKTKEVILPSGATAVIRTTLPVSGEQAITAARDAEVKDAPDKQAGGLVTAITTAFQALVSWDFQEDDGTPMIITMENFRRIPNTDAAQLLRAFRGEDLTEEEAKVAKALEEDEEEEKAVEPTRPNVIPAGPDRR